MHVFGGNRLDVIHAFHEFSNAENPQSQRDNFNPVRHMQEAEGKALLGGIHVGSGNAHQQTQNGHGYAFERRAARKGRPRQKPQQHQCANIGRAEFKRNAHQNRRKENHFGDTERGADKRRNHGNPQCCAAPSFQGHGIAVETGDGMGRMHG